MKRNAITCLILLILFVFTGINSAFPDETGNAPLPPGENKTDQYHRTALSNITQILDKETTIATRTKINADYVPGMVTVLHGEDLERRGVRTVLEAMELVPGWNVSIQNVVRGVGDVFASGKIKTMLNGMPVNTAHMGGSYILNIDIESVKRIEVIRGPGSAIHGKWAYLGVVNIITRSASNRIFGRVGEFDAYAGGVQLAYDRPEDCFSFNLNVSSWETDPTDITTKRDSLHGTDMESISRAPGPVNNSREVSKAVASLTYRDFSLTGQMFRYGVGDYYGMADALPPESDRKFETEDADMIHLKWLMSSSRYYKIELYGEWRRHMWEIDEMNLYPPGYAGLEDGIIIGPHYEERAYRGGVDILINSLPQHQVLLGIEYEYLTMENPWHDGNLNPVTMAPVEGIQRFTGAENWLVEDREQKLFSVVLQDQYEAMANLSITGGIRYDNYSGMDNRISPRLAGVYALTDQHILKAQYAEAFRPPTFMESHSNSALIIMGNPDLESEIIKTFELGYIFLDDVIETRITLFRSILDDLIVVTEDQQGNSQYSNTGKVESYGAEIETQWTIFTNLTVDGNISYVETEDKESGREIPGVAQWMANAGGQYRFLNDYVLGVQYHYAGERSRSSDDPRTSLKGNDRIDATFSIENFITKGLTLRTGVRNLLDEDIFTPSYPGGYPDDYPITGRECWIQASLKF